MRAHIKKRSSGSYSLVIPTGLPKPKQRWITVRGTLREAEAELAKLIHDASNGGFVASPKMKFADYLDRWLKDAAAPTVASKTLERYEQIVRDNIAPGLGAMEISKVTPMAIQKFYSDCRSTGRKNGRGGLSEQTVLHIHRVLHKALAQAVRWQLIPRNPADAVEAPKALLKPMRSLTDEETREVFQKLTGNPLLVPTLVALSTGIRRGELLALRWSDIDLGRKSLIINSALEQTKSGGVRRKQPKTERSRRNILLPDAAVELLHTHKTAQATARLRLGPAYQNNDLAFPLPDGAIWPPNKFSDQFRGFVRRSGLQHFRFHDLRHTHASQLLLANVHPKVVSERLGHSSVSITLDRYSHLLPGLQEGAANVIDGPLRAALGNQT